jgi:helicase MOV-10
MNKSDLYRFYAPSRSVSAASVELIDCTTPGKEGGFLVPTIERVQASRVVISTCGSASFAHNIKIKPGFFTHIFIDEAGQGSEPEVMVPIKSMADTRANIVLSGDPKQLGPIIRSAAARELGLGKSYLERLMEREVYDESSNHNKTYITISLPLFPT